MSANLENSAVTIKTGKFQFSFQSKRRAIHTKEHLNYNTIVLISQVRKEILKILQARLQWSMNWELPDRQAGLRKGRGTSDDQPVINC